MRAAEEQCLRRSYNILIVLCYVMLRVSYVHLPGTHQPH